MGYQEIYKNNTESKECPEKQINGNGRAEEGEMHSREKGKLVGRKNYKSISIAWRLCSGSAVKNLSAV